jgi:hypothetical protein
LFFPFLILFPCLVTLPSSLYLCGSLILFFLFLGLNFLFLNVRSFLLDLFSGLLTLPLCLNLSCCQILLLLLFKFGSFLLSFPIGLDLYRSIILFLFFLFLLNFGSIFFSLPVCLYLCRSFILFKFFFWICRYHFGVCLHLLRGSHLKHIYLFLEIIL